MALRVRRTSTALILMSDAWPRACDSEDEGVNGDRLFESIDQSQGRPEPVSGRPIAHLGSWLSKHDARIGQTRALPLLSVG
eukprot:scaffold53193_cov35-Tisochrysis_lutea.AAC.2